MASIMKNRPMTLKQAKQAFRKSGGPKLTEKELRLMKRNAELFEREQKCKEKEKAKREHKRKRQEKEEKLREQRRKMGVPEKEEGYVSPRQVRLGVYFGMGKETDRKENISNTKDAEDASRWKDNYSITASTTARSVRQDGVWSKLNNIPDDENEDQLKDLNARPMSTGRENRMQKHSLTVATVDDEDRQTTDFRENPDKTESDPRIMSDTEDKDFSKSFYSNTKFIPEEAVHSRDTRKGCTGWRMPLHEVAACNVSQASHVTTKLPEPAFAATPLEENDWMFLLPSNTQVERELSDSSASQILPNRQAQRSQPRISCVKAMQAIATPEFASLVDLEPVEDVFTDIPFISTQDLEFTEDEIADLTTPRTIPKHETVLQDRTPSNEVLEAEKNVLPSSDFGEFGLSTQDFLNLLSPISSKSAGPGDLLAKTTKDETVPFDFGDFPVATQEFLDLVG